ncbi:MAG TPA: porin [Casimicrobiaceae bacterium]
MRRGRRQSAWRLAALAGLACAAASGAVRADAVNATLYGQINTSIDYVVASAPDRQPPSSLQLASNNSRFGFRGAEYIGNGQLVIWQIETGFNADAGGGIIASRETYLGVEGDWGRLRAGFFLTPYDDMSPIFGNAPTFTTSILSTAALWAQGGFPKTNGGFDRRTPNSLRFDSADLDGFQGSLQYSLGENSEGSSVFGAGMSWFNGPLETGLAYEYNHKVRGPTLDDWALTAAAAWNFGPARIGGVYERLNYQTPSGTLTRNLWGGSLTVPVGSGTVYAFAARAGEGRGPTDARVGGLTGGEDSGAWQYELSFSYPLSSRTILYTGFVGLSNERNASYIFAVNPYTEDSPTGLRLRGFVLGAVHLF